MRCITVDSSLSPIVEMVRDFAVDDVGEIITLNSCLLSPVMWDILHLAVISACQRGRVKCL